MHRIGKAIKKIAVIGRGTAGCLSASYFKHNSPCEIEWIFDSSIPAQSVGEGSTLEMPKQLFAEMNIGYTQLEHIGGNLKVGARKINYNGSGDYLHEFYMGTTAVHFSADKLQNISQNILSHKGVKLVDRNVKSHDEIDADFIMDCSGRPKEYSQHHIAEYTSVNAAHIVQIPWQRPLFNYTLAIARPHGWIFGIPLLDRCSMGYLYNRDISSLEDVVSDFDIVLKEYNFSPSGTPNSFPFESYYKKENFTERAAWNGNASFFLEPLEATSVGQMHAINTLTKKMLFDDLPLETANAYYLQDNKQNEHMIMMHYWAGSKFDTEFWKYSKERGTRSMHEMVSSNKFKQIFYQATQQAVKTNFGEILESATYGQWPAFAWFQNFAQLDKFDDVINMIKEQDGNLHSNNSSV